jgi:dolichol-phosphate mannosyltransferase
MFRSWSALDSSYRHAYDIDGLVRIKSSVRLPELEFFRSSSVPGADIVIRTRPVGGWAPRLNIAIKNGSSRLEYREHLGPLFANFAVDMEDPVVVTAGPLLALSPHVLYTNVVEPLLRFLLASKDKMLLHAACISVGGRPIMLSAKTDTGKTSTILTMLRSDEGVFYSDDMVIIDENGIASRYPKPLTISAHTLRAVPQHRLKLSQRWSLSWQSRLHSREGRSVGKRLGAANLPIMSMNAVVQAIIPPPKYRVTDLVTCAVGSQVRMESLYVIERGTPALTESISRSDAVEELLENTEDAYGFPPYSSLAPHLTIRGKDRDNLRTREREILTSALTAVDVQRIRVPDYSWPAQIKARSQTQAAVAPVESADQAPVAAGEWVDAAGWASGQSVARVN